MRKSGLALMILAVLAAPAVAADRPSVALGRKLFESTALGTNGKSCADCHPGGKKLETAAGLDDEELGGIINQCITRPLRGTALDPAGPEMKSLIMYLRTFATRGG